MNLFIIILFIVYIHYGLLVLFQIIIWLLVLFLSNTLIGINPYSLVFIITRLLSVIVILYIIIINSNDSSYNLMLLVPFSLDKIHYVHNFEIKFLNFTQEKGSIVFLESLTKDLTSF
jgi:lysylphosphatidylglycerol synthetase-like protein (DUF2156 family)